MWPRCRGRRLPVKLTGAPAAPTAPAAGGSDSSGGGPPLSLVVDCSLQAAPDATETRVQAVASLPDGQQTDTCGCSRKPCCCAPTTQQKQDQLRPASYLPREALFKTLGRRWYHLVPFPDTEGSNEEDRPRNLLLKLVTDNAGEDGNRGVYLLQPVQERAPTALSEGPTAQNSIAEEADHIRDPHQRTSPTSVPSPQAALERERPARGQETPHRDQQPSENRPSSTMGDGAYREMCGRRLRHFLGKTLTDLEAPIGGSHAGTVNEAYREICGTRLRQFLERTLTDLEAPTGGSHAGTVNEAYREMCGTRLRHFLGNNITDLEAPIGGSHARMDNEAFRELCSTRLRIFLPDDPIYLRTPIETSQDVIVEERDTDSLPQGSNHVPEEAPTTGSHENPSIHPEVDEWVVEEVDVATQTSQEEFPIPEELNAVTDDASLEHIPDSPLPLEGELRGMDEVDEWGTVMVEEVDVATQTSQAGFPIPEELNVVTNNTSLEHMRDSPLPLDGELRGVDNVDEWGTVVVEEVDMATQTSQELFPIPDELSPVIKKSSLTHIQESPAAVEEEMEEVTDSHRLQQMPMTGDMPIQGSLRTVHKEPPKEPSSQLLSGGHEHTPMGRKSLAQGSRRITTERQTSDQHESVSIHAQDEDERKSVLVESEAARQTSSLAQGSRRITTEHQTSDQHESVNIHAQDADERKSVVVEPEAARQTSQERLLKPEELSASLAVDKPPQEDSQPRTLLPDVLVTTELRPSDDMMDDTAQPHESLKTRKDQDSSRVMTSIQGSKHAIVDTASGGKLIERMGVRKETMESVPSLVKPNKESYKTEEIKPSRFFTSLERLSATAGRPLRVLPRMTGEASKVTLHSKQGSASDEDETAAAVRSSQQVTEAAPTTDHREDAEQGLDVEELEATAKTSKAWLSSAEELIAKTIHASLASIRESPLEMMEEPPDVGHIKEAKSQKEKVSTRAETPTQGIQKATEEAKLDETYTAKLIVGPVSPPKKKPVRGIRFAKEVTTQGARQQTSATPEGTVQILKSARDRLRKATSPDERSSQVQQVPATSSESKQVVHPATGQQLPADRVTEKSITKQEPDLPGTTTNVQRIPPVTEEILREDQHPVKLSSQPKKLSVKISKWQQDDQPATKETLQTTRLAKIKSQEPISPGTSTNIQGAKPVTEKTLRGDLHSKIHAGQQDRYAAKLEIPAVKTQPTKEETSEGHPSTSQGRTSPGTFPFRQESASPKPAGHSTIRARLAPGRLQVKTDKTEQEAPESVTRSGRAPSKLKFWEKMTSPETTQEKTPPKPKPKPPKK